MLTVPQQSLEQKQLRSSWLWGIQVLQEMMRSFTFASEHKTQIVSMYMETNISFYPHSMHSVGYLVTLHVLAACSVLWCLTLFPHSLPLHHPQPQPACPHLPPHHPPRPMPGKWAGLQESGWVDAMMSGHQAAAFLTC